MSRARPVAVSLLLFSAIPGALRAQVTDKSSDYVRVTVSVNADGSRTTYQWDTAHHKATATTTDAGRPREKIRYVLDDAGRFVSGEVFGPKDALRFTTRYKYDVEGRLAEESQLSKEGVLQHRIVHSYDSAGKEIGYAVYDAGGKLISRTAAPAKTAR